MKYFLSLSFLFCLTLLTAQPVINTDIIPSVGAQWTGFFFQVDTLDYSAGAAGANMAWDFSSLADSIEGTPQELLEELKEEPFFTFTVVDPATAIFGDSFPTADFAIQTFIDFFIFSEIYSFVDQQADGLRDLGESSIIEIDILGTTIIDTSVVVNESPDLFFPLPINYNGSFIRVDTETEEDISFDSKTVTTTRDSIVYDAYGTLITPFASFDNAVRWKVYSTETELTTSLSSGQIISNITRTTVYYQWYSSDELAPLIQYDLPGVGEEQGIMTFYIKIDEVSSNKNIARKKMALKVAPNPATDQIQMQFSLEQSVDQLDAYLYDMSGRLVKREHWNGLGAGSQAHSLSIPAGTQRGTYVLQLRNKDFIAYQKVVIK